MFQYGMTFIGLTVLALIAGAHFAVASAVARRDEWMPTRNRDSDLLRRQRLLGIRGCALTSCSALQKTPIRSSLITKL